MRKVIYLDKVEQGTTLLTSVHHIDTPINLREGHATIGNVWITEVLYQRNRLANDKVGALVLEDESGQPLKYTSGAAVDRRDVIYYQAAVLRAAKNKRAAKDFVAFLTSSGGQAILEKAGFIPVSKLALKLQVPRNVCKRTRCSKYGTALNRNDCTSQCDQEDLVGRHYASWVP